MTLDELLKEHDALCGPGVPMSEWAPRWRKYETARHELLRQGIDLEVEIGKRQGRVMSKPDPEELQEKIAMLEAEPSPALPTTRKRRYWWQR